MRIAYPLENCGLFYYVGPKPVALPLDGVHVSVRIVDLVAEVQVVQFYVNPTGNLIDTKYTFPLDESAAVCGFEAELEDKLLIGEVREKEEARAEYNAAIARGETAALLEQDKADVFTQRIGNIRPYSRVNIRITYVADLKVESDGAVRFALPTSVAPRYSPYGESFSDYRAIPWRRNWRHVCLGRRVLYYHDYDRWCRRGSYIVEELPWYDWHYYTPEHVINRDRPCSFSTTIEVEMPSRIVEMESPTHTLKWERGATQEIASASFWHDTEPMGKDLVLRIYQEKPHEPHAEIEVAPDGSGCAMVTMVPEFDLEPEPTEIVFLVDCSGSMAGARIQAAVRALQVFLRSLPMTCHFNIYKFGSRYTQLFNGDSQPYTEHTLQQATNHVSQISANLGGTEILQPLTEIFRRKVAGEGRARQVFVLTDGQVSNTEQVIEICRKNAHNSRVFTVGIGDDVSRALVEGMARAATGTAQFIVGSELTGSTGALESKLINQLRLATQPSITKVLIDWGQLGALQPPEFFAQPAAQPAAAQSAAASNGTPVLLTIKVNCDKTEFGEDLYITGDSPALGAWDPSKAVRMSTSPETFPTWAATIIVPAGSSLAFKFMKKKSDGYAAWETFDGNREATVALFSEATIDAGSFNVKSVSQAAASPVQPAAQSAQPAAQPAPAPAHPGVPTASVHVGGGVMVTGPNTGSRPVSKFFQMGPAQKSAPHSVNSVGSGPAVHSPSSLAPAVSAYNDASDAQAHARNAELYQAPFLPPPVFSNSKFVMYAFFAPGALPTNSIRITAESPEGPMEIDVPITKLTSVGKTLHVLAARALIRDLDEGTSHLHWRRTNVPAAKRGGGDGNERRWFSGWLRRDGKAVGGKGQDKGSAWGLEPVTPPAHVVRAEMIDLGVRYGLVSSATSFVAVERWRDGRSGSSNVPMALPSQQVAPAPQPQPQPQQQQQMFAFGGGGAAPASSRSSSLAKPSAGPTSNSYAAAPSAAPQMMSFGAPPAAPPAAPRRAMAAPMMEMEKRERRSESKDKKKMSRSRSPQASLKSAVHAESISYFDQDEAEGEDVAVQSFVSDSFDAPVPVAAVGSLTPSGPPPTALFMQQKFDGSFEISDALASLLGTSAANMRAGASNATARLGNLDAATVQKVWASIYVLAMLQKWWSAYEDSWRMAADKANQWCISVLLKSLGDRAAARRLVDDLISTI